MYSVPSQVTIPHSHLWVGGQDEMAKEIRTVLAHVHE
jgi:hypothetical protein